jgi:hypothetical protein
MQKILSLFLPTSNTNKITQSENKKGNKRQKIQGTGVPIPY